MVGRGCMCRFLKGLFLGYFDEFLLWQTNGCEIGSSDEFYQGNFEWTPAG